MLASPSGAGALPALSLTFAYNCGSPIQTLRCRLTDRARIAISSAVLAQGPDIATVVLPPKRRPSCLPALSVEPGPHRVPSQKRSGHAHPRQLYRAQACFPTGRRRS